MHLRTIAGPLLWGMLAGIPSMGQHASHHGGGTKAETQNKSSDQHPGHELPPMESVPAPEPAEMLLLEQASGTATNPPSAPIDMQMGRTGSWTWMLHGLAFISELQQTGARGGDKFFSTNWFMASAQQSVGGGKFMGRVMLSLEPATVTQRRYPELFQTGETAFGRPIVDGQHPHDLFMELGLQYARPLGENGMFNIYFAPVGDPALGPVAFPHRVSAAEIPQAPLAHHLQDSTHIANEVITAGLQYRILRFEVSGFHGAEPNENRWNIDHGAIDSWGARLTLQPTDDLSGQISMGRIEQPEAAELGDIVRSTASITFNRPLAGGNWATSFIWGRNHKVAEQQNLNSYLAETVLQIRERNYATARVELLDRDELGKTVSSVFRIAAFTAGYTRDFDLIPGLKTGLGGNATVYRVPSTLKPFYGDHPVAVYGFLRLRLRGKAPMSHGTHP